MRIFLYLIIFILLILTAALFFIFAPVGLSKEQVRFIIPLETKENDVPAMLKKEGLIRSEAAYNFLNNTLHFGKIIEPGAYMLSKNMNLFNILETLIYKPYQKWIVIAPGLRVEQIAERLQKKFNWDEAKTKDFLDNAREGYMFPDTYLLNVDYSGKDTALRFISNFNEKFDAKLQADLLSQNVRNDTAVKIASLIERESGGDEDKALIAGIIWNRLNQDMKLQIDAVNQYIIGKPGDWWPRVTRQHLKIDHPYNTYIYISGYRPAPSPTRAWLQSGQPSIPPKPIVSIICTPRTNKSTARSPTKSTWRILRGI